jgi:N-methylhydantoinase A
MVALGVDIGGTFTDIVLSGAGRAVVTRKVPSTPSDYGTGICAGVAGLLRQEGLDPSSVEVVVHATTVATNAVLEGKGARTGLITTAGFRDVLEFRRVRVPELYNLGYVKPKPLVPRQFRLEVVERLGADGRVRVPLDEESVRVAARRLREGGIEAVAICLLHSYLDPTHEYRVRDLVAEAFGGEVFITCSYDILPEMREYERTSTTVVNAFLGPVMSRYLGQLRARLREIGITSSLQVMTSGGGQMGLEAAISKPAYLVESGPAAGVIAAARIAGQQRLHDVITLDMGGTTAKAAMVENSQPTRTSEYEIGAGINLSAKLVKGAGYAVKLPFIDISEIGAGGGSELWFDKGGLLKVGPRSAGSEPGPVCYGKGGTRATLTDALLVLGYINPDYLVGGDLRLDAAQAWEAVRAQVAVPLGVSVPEAAYGAFTVATANMVRAVKSVSTYQGRDPRGYTLLAFGGNGPIVGAAIARELSMRRVLVPPHSGVLSACGLLVADHEHEQVRAWPGSLRQLDPGGVGVACAALREQAVAALRREGFAEARIAVSHMADLRYVGQAFELSVPLAAEAVPDLSALAEAFHQAHLRTYAHMAPEEPVEMVNLRVLARVKGEAGALAPFRPAAGSAGPRQREAYFGAAGMRSTAILGRGDLVGRSVAGPLIVEEYDATCVVPPGSSATVDAAGNIIVSVEV